MGKSTHFSGQPLYGQVIKLLDKSKILQISRKNGGERYTKCFNIWVHIVVMLYAVIMRFDSLREITASLLAEARKLNHLGLTFKIGRSTLADANKRHPEHIYTVIHANEGVPSDIRFTSAATNDSFMLRPATLNKGDIMAMDRPYIDYEKFEQLTERGVVYVTKMKKSLKYKILKDTAYQTPDGLMEVRVQEVVFTKKLMDMQKVLKRQWGFSGLATMVRITLMYYVDFHSLFNNPEKDWENVLAEASEIPPEPTLFD